MSDISSELASIDALQAQMEAEARKNGRLEMANEILQWWVSHLDEVPQHLREGFAQLVLRACK